MILLRLAVSRLLDGFADLQLCVAEAGLQLQGGIGANLLPLLAELMHDRLIRLLK